MNYYIDAIEAWKASRPKARGEWKLGELSNEQLAEVLTRLLRRETYSSIIESVEKEFSVSLGSARSLSDFYSGVKHFIGPARRRAVLNGARAAGPLSDEEREQIDASNIALLTERANELLENPESNREELSLFVNAVLRLQEHSLKSRDLAIKLRRLEMLEKTSNKAKETLKDGSLSLTQREQRMKEIFGIS